MNAFLRSICFFANYYQLIIVYDGLQEIWNHCLKALVPNGCKFQIQKEKKKNDGEKGPKQWKSEFSRLWKYLAFWRSSQTDGMKKALSCGPALLEALLEANCDLCMLINVSKPQSLHFWNEDNIYLAALFWGLKIMSVKVLAHELAS